MTIPFNGNPSEPNLADVLAQKVKEFSLGLNCHHLGTIQGFDEDEQTATVTINYKQTFFVRADSGQYVQKLVDYPILIDCPVIFLSGGDAALTFPVSPGDECLVLFNDRDMDNWWAGNSSTGPETSRLHSFSDALILVGVRSMSNVLADFDMVRAGFRSKTGETVLSLNPDTQKILISNTYPGNATTLNSLLAQLISEIQALVVATAAITVSVSAAPGTSSVPLNAATITAISAQLSTTATQIAGLLE